MSVSAAADRWETATREMASLKAERDTAAEVLKEYFRKNGKRDYRGRISYSVSSRLQKRVTSESLSLLK